MPEFAPTQEQLIRLAQSENLNKYLSDASQANRGSPLGNLKPWKQSYKSVLGNQGNVPKTANAMTKGTIPTTQQPLPNLGELTKGKAPKIIQLPNPDSAKIGSQSTKQIGSAATEQIAKNSGKFARAAQIGGKYLGLAGAGYSVINQAPKAINSLGNQALLFNQMALQAVDQIPGVDNRAAQIANLKRLGMYEDSQSGFSEMMTGATQTFTAYGELPFKGGQGVGVGYYVTVEIKYANGEIRTTRRGVSYGKIGGTGLNARNIFYPYNAYYTYQVDHPTKSAGIKFVSETSNYSNRPISAKIILIERADGLPDEDGDPEPTKQTVTTEPSPRPTINLSPNSPTNNNSVPLPTLKPKAINFNSPKNSPLPTSDPIDDLQKQLSPQNYPNSEYQLQPKSAESSSPALQGLPFAEPDLKDFDVLMPLPELKPKSAKDGMNLTIVEEDVNYSPRFNDETGEIEQERRGRRTYIPPIFAPADSPDPNPINPQKPKAQTRKIRKDPPKQSIPKNNKSKLPNKDVFEEPKKIPDPTKVSPCAIPLSCHPRTFASINKGNKQGERILDTAKDTANKAKDLLGKLPISEALSLMSTVASIHNGILLSRDIGQTMFSAVDLALETIGLSFKDGEGNTIGLGEILGNSVEGFATAIFGAQNLTELNNLWISLNRIYQASSSIYYETANILDEARQIQTEIAENVAFIGNAMRNEGLVSDNAFPPMDSDLQTNGRFNKLIERLEKVEQAAQTFESIASGALSITQSITEIGEQRNAWTAAKTQLETDAQAIFEENTIASTSPDIVDADLLENEG